MSTDQACEVVCFDVHTCQVSKESHRDQRWHSWTSVLGFPVMGIWPLYADGTDVNAVDRSPDGRYLLTADDSGMVGCLLTNVCVCTPEYELERETPKSTTKYRTKDIHTHSDGTTAASQKYFPALKALCYTLSSEMWWNSVAATTR